MFKDIRQYKICNCSTSNNNNIFKSDIKHSFCDKCGSILIKGSNGNIYYTIKPKQKNKNIELNPIEVIKSMKKKTEQDYPYLNNEYNMNDIEITNKESVSKSINIYLIYRKMIITNLQKVMKMLDYSDLIFYQCLFYIDHYLSHNMTEDMSEKKILYYLVGYFLISAKFKETDIYEPNLDSFCCLKKKIYLSMEKIAYYEMLCLKSIKYNFFSYSAYDWLSELITNGIVFDCEINKNNSIVLINGHRHSILSTINKYAMKLLLNITIKNIFIKFSPMYIAFSLIQIAREKYLDKNNINTKLFNNLINLYGVNFSDYKKCYKEIKAEIEKKINESNETKDILETEKNVENSPKNEKQELFNIEKLKKGSQDDTNNNNHCKMDKNVIVSNKMRSSNTILHVRENLIKTNEENENHKKDYNDKFIIDNTNDKIINGNINDNNKNDGFNKNIDKIIHNTSKDDNIIVYEEDNKKENIDNINIDYKFDFDTKEEASNDTNDTNNNKIKSSHDLSHVKLKINNHLLIDCNNVFRSNDNLPIINSSLDQNSPSISYTNKKMGNSRYSTLKNDTNVFLKTNQKTLNPVKSKRTLSLKDNNRYYQNNTNNNRFKIKEEFDSMRKSLFYDNSNQKKISTKEGVRILTSTIDLQKSSKLTPIMLNDEILVKENNDENNNDNINKYNKDNCNNNNKKRMVCKSKGRPNNTLSTKETKAYVPNKRNQSTYQMKRRIIKSTLDANNANLNNNNLKIKKTNYL